MSSGPPNITDSQVFPVDVAMCSMGTQTEDVPSTSPPPTVNPSSLRLNKLYTTPNACVLLTAHRVMTALF